MASKIARFKGTGEVLGTVHFESETALLVEDGVRTRLFFKVEVDLETTDDADEPVSTTAP